MAVRAARTSRQLGSKAPSRARARNRPARAGKMFPRGHARSERAGEAGTIGSTTQRLMSATSGTTNARGQGKISARVGERSERPVAGPARRRTLISPGASARTVIQPG